MTESELVKRITDMHDENRRYESEIVHLKEFAERLAAENNELNGIKADLEDDNRHLAERVKMLEHKRDELLDELKRVGGDEEHDIVVGQLIAYRQMFRMILSRDKEWI